MCQNNPKYKKLSQKWIDYLNNQPESGMGYQIAIVTLKNGKIFDDVVIIQSTLIIEIKGYNEIPFESDDISEIKVSPSKKYWNKEPGTF